MSIFYESPCMYLYHAFWPNEKRYRPEIWYTSSPGTHLKTGFLFFRKSDPRAASLKNRSVTWIYRISPRIPCLQIFISRGLVRDLIKKCDQNIFFLFFNPILVVLCNIATYLLKSPKSKNQNPL